MKFEDIGEMLKQERLLRGWSVDEAAKRADIPTDELRDIENGEGDIGRMMAEMERAFTILKAAGVGEIAIEEDGNGEN